MNRPQPFYCPTCERDTFKCGDCGNNACNACATPDCAGCDAAYAADQETDE